MSPPLDEIDRIMAVMATAFDPAYGEAWNRRQIEDALLSGHCHVALIAQDGAPPAGGEEAVGFALLRTLLDEEELLLFAIAPRWRQRGLGAMLLGRVIADARSRGMVRMMLEMRAGNSAESLYRRFSFIPVGKRAKYYRAPNGELLDAITFACNLGE